MNNIGRTRLETVLETVSEVSNSKIESSEISDDNENRDIKKIKILMKIQEKLKQKKAEKIRNQKILMLSKTYKVQI
jgi:hypothetical protein